MAGVTGLESWVVSPALCLGREPAESLERVDVFLVLGFATKSNAAQSWFNEAKSLSRLVQFSS